MEIKKYNKIKELPKKLYPRNYNSKLDTILADAKPFVFNSKVSYKIERPTELSSGGYVDYCK